MYPVLYVGFICKGCVWERVCEDSRLLKTKVIFAGSLRVGFLRSEAYAQYMTGMRRVKTGWRQLVFGSVSWVRLSSEISAKHSVLLNCHIWYTLSVSTLYIPTLPIDVEECFWKKTLATNLESSRLLYPHFSTQSIVVFHSTPTSPFLYPWEVDSPNTYHTHSECQVRFWCCWEALEEARLWRMQSDILRDLES